MEDHDKNLNQEAVRLSDRVLYALDLALDQKDIEIADILSRALELSMTRNSGGEGFSERRDYPADVEKAMSRLAEIKKDQLG